MRSITSWLINILAVIFWLFRVVITFCDTMSIDFIIKPIDINTEITLLFITLVCLILIFKRNIIGGLTYFAIYGWYFGTEAVNMITTNENIDILSLCVCVFAILLALVNAVDIALSKVRKKENPNKKTDWFYKNEQYDRKLDERADKNNYRTL